MSERSKIEHKLDSVFSGYIRYRDRWTCVLCKTTHPEKSQNLHNSHFWGRANRGTRWDERNCDALCGKVFKNVSGRTILVSCHGKLEVEKQGAYRELKLKQLGEDQYRFLEMRARTVTKYPTCDLKIMLDYFKNALEEEKEKFKEVSE